MVNLTKKIYSLLIVLSPHIALATITEDSGWDQMFGPAEDTGGDFYSFILFAILIIVLASIFTMIRKNSLDSIKKSLEGFAGPKEDALPNKKEAIDELKKGLENFAGPKPEDDTNEPV